MSIYTDWIGQRDDYMSKYMDVVDPTQRLMLQDANSSASGAPIDPSTIPQLQQQWDKDFTKYHDQFINSLTPERRADYLAHMSGHNDNIAKQGKIIKPLALGIIAAAGLGAAGQAAGLSSLFGGGAETAGSSALESAYGAGSGWGGDTLSAMGLSGADAGGAGVSTLAESIYGAGSGWGGDTLSAMGLGGDSLTVPTGWEYGSAGRGLDTVSAVGGNSAGGLGLTDFVKGLLPKTVSEGVKLLGSLGGLYSSYTQNKNLGEVAKDLKGLYGPDSAYEEQLRKELMRRDAAAGRRSQYGPRSVELQARLAQLASGQSNTLSNIYGAQNNSLNNMINSGISLLDQTDLLGRLGTLFGG